MLRYQDILSREFKRRVRDNAHYSLRAFARDLGLSPGFLSQVLASKKKLGLDRASQVVAHLDCPQKHKLLFLNLVRLEQARSEELRSVIRDELRRPPKKLLDFRPLDTETFQIVAHWYYHAILALTSVAGFKSDAKWIAERLGVSLKRVKEALSLLEKLQLIQRQPDGEILSRAEMLKVDSIPSRAIREHHRQYLELAMDALEAQGFGERDFSGSTFAINPQRLPEAKRLIKEFREAMAELLDEAGQNKEVYRLSVQLFRVKGTEDSQVGG